MTGPPSTVRTFAGQPEHVSQVRAWVRALAAATCPAAADYAELAAAELAANAIAHTRSGRAGGTFTVTVAADPDRITIHVHDLGTGDGRVPAPRPAADDDGLAEGGRGLPIVIALSAESGTRPATQCPAREPDDPAGPVGGCCAWCRLDAEPHYEQDQSGPPAQTSPPGGEQRYNPPGSAARSIQ